MMMKKGGRRVYYVYVVRTESGSLYTGIAKDLSRRLKEHCSKSARGAKYTKSHSVISLEGLWSCRDRSAASRLEAAFKSLPKKKKEAVLQSAPLLFTYLPAVEKDDFVYHPLACLELFLGKIKPSQLL